MSENSIPWSGTDKCVLVIFIFEVILLGISVLGWLGLGELMFYPSFMQLVKTITIGISLFACRVNACGRWVSATILWITVVTDIIYYLFWWFILTAILALGCGIHQVKDQEHKEACDTYGAIWTLWVWGCLLIYVFHIVSAVMMCVWGCQANNLES